MREDQFISILSTHHTAISVPYYCKILECERDTWTRRARSEKIWFLLQENTKPPIASIFWEFLEKGKIKVLAQPVYSANFAPYDIRVFGDLKWELCIRRFQLYVRLVIAANHFFEDLPPEELHKMMTSKWKERMLTCIENDGGYFEEYIVDDDDDNDNR